MRKDPQKNWDVFNWDLDLLYKNKFLLVSGLTKLMITSLDWMMGSDESSEEESLDNEDMQPCGTQCHVWCLL